MRPTVSWEDDGVVMIDQRRLPHDEVYVTCRDYREVAAAIRDMVIRGAPAIGVAAALGLVLAVSGPPGAETLEAEFERACDELGRTRPTAVNLCLLYTSDAADE